MLQSKPGRKYRIKLSNGTIIPNAVRTRNTWNEINTGKFLAYDQNVIDCEGTFYCPEHGPELLWLSSFNESNEYQVNCDYCDQPLTDSKPDYKYIETENESGQQSEPKQRDEPLTQLDKMNQARLDKALNKLYRFDTGTYTLRDYISKGSYIRKTTHIRNHSNKRINLSYKKIRDTYTYTLWDENDNGIDVPKIVYNSIELPERIRDSRF